MAYLLTGVAIKGQQYVMLTDPCTVTHGDLLIYCIQKLMGIQLSYRITEK